MNANSWNCTKSYPSNMEIRQTLTPTISYGHSHFGLWHASGFSSVDFQIFCHVLLIIVLSLSCIFYPLNADATDRIPVLTSFPAAKEHLLPKFQQPEKKQ